MSYFIFISLFKILYQRTMKLFTLKLRKIALIFVVILSILIIIYTLKKMNDNYKVRLHCYICTQCWENGHYYLAQDCPVYPVINKSHIELEMQDINSGQHEAEIRFLSNIDSFISVITSQSYGRVGNILMAYSSLMVGLFSLEFLSLYCDTSILQLTQSRHGDSPDIPKTLMVG